MGVGFIRHLPEACLCAYICTPLRSYLRVHAYLRLAEYSLPTLPVTPLSSHTSHLLLGSVRLLSAPPSPLVPQAEGRGTFFTPPLCAHQAASLTLCWPCGMLPAFQPVDRATCVLCQTEMPRLAVWKLFQWICRVPRETWLPSEASKWVHIVPFALFWAFPLFLTSSRGVMAYLMPRFRRFPRREERTVRAETLP